MLAREPNTPRASAFETRGAGNSHVEPPSPMYPNSATSSTLYAVVTPGGQLTTRTNESPRSTALLPTGPTTGGSRNGGTHCTVSSAPEHSGATVFETALAKQEIFEQYGYYPDSPPPQPAPGLPRGVDPGRERWLMLTTEFDTPQGLGSTPNGPFSWHSRGEGSSTASLQSSARESLRSRSAQFNQFGHMTRSPTKTSASMLSRRAPTGPRSGPQSGPASGCRDSGMLQWRDDGQGGLVATPAASRGMNTRSLLLSPRSPYARMGQASSSQVDSPEHMNPVDVTGPVGAAQLSTVDDTSGSVPGNSGTPNAPSFSQHISTEGPASRQVLLLALRALDVLVGFCEHIAFKSPPAEQDSTKKHLSSLTAACIALCVVVFLRSL